MPLLTNEEVMEFYNDIRKQFVTRRPVTFKIDNTAECPQIINDEEEARITIPLNQIEASNENVVEICNSITHELAHAITYEKLSVEVKEKILSDHYSVKYIAYHILNEFLAYDYADRLYPQRHYHGARSEIELQRMFERGGRELYFYKCIGPITLYGYMIDYFDNIFKCYYGNGKRFQRCSDRFAQNLYETIEILNNQNIETITWDDFEKLYFQIIGTLFKNEPAQMQEFYDGINALIVACKGEG